MPTRLVHLVMDANDVPALAGFWAAALGWEIDDASDEEIDVSPAGFSYPGPDAVPLVLVPVPERKAGKNRVHLDLASQSPAHQAELVSRVRDLGAQPVDLGQGDVPWVVLADPEGNEFCVLEPREVYAGTGPVAAIVMDCADPAAEARFWTQAAGWPVMQAADNIVGLRSPSGAGPFLELLRVPGAAAVKDRLHPDVAPLRGETVAAEAARLVRAGASPADVGQGDKVTWTVLADPEGHEFCVLSPR
jgi:predicted enzyme related to lactoylglutathione lyase